jgi:hypothetical protein
MNKVQSQKELISIRVERLYKQGNECNVYTPWPREPGTNSVIRNERMKDNKEAA